AIPPLRMRVSEIAGLARRFAHDAARALSKSNPELTGDALEVLEAHRWPGNVRELRSVIERAVLLASGDVIRAHDIALARGAPDLDRPALLAGDDPASPLGESAVMAEREQISDALARCGGNQSRAARLLGISRNTLIGRIAKYGLARPLMPRR